jgi:homocitrate synthase NifV
MGQISVSFANPREAHEILELVRYANVEAQKPLVEEELLFIARHLEVVRKLLTLTPPDSG